MTRNFITAALSGALLVAMVSCGDDSDKGTSPVVSDDATATTLDAAGAKAAYCAIEASVDAMFTAAFTGIGPPSDEISATVAAAVLEQYGDQALAAAPPEIADDVAVVVAATAKMAEGNPGAFDTFIDETQVAGDVIAEFCGT
ncbi:MAG: hypothetical protein Q7V88_13935 [Actinomycetota bacterium]|nr:hypothetical protein [Actinomycetota bacterium]